MFEVKSPKTGPVDPESLKQHFDGVFLLHNALLLVAFLAPQLPTALFWLALRVHILSPVNYRLNWFPNALISRMDLETQKRFTQACDNRVIGEIAITAVYLLGFQQAALTMLILLNCRGLATTYQFLKNHR